MFLESHPLRFQALLDNCGQATCDLCTESQIVTADGRAQLNASLRNRFVRGQTLPTNQSFLGTFFRSADINDKAALAYRGADWGILAGDVECDRQKVDDGVPFGSVPGGNCVTKNGTVTGNTFNNESRAYHNRWYLDQHRAPGTPLWPVGAKSEFGVCCAYQYATFGTNGYRATSPGSGTDVPFNEGGKLKGTNADAYNRRAASRGFRLTTPLVPDILRDRHAMCYRDGPEIRANAPFKNMHTLPRPSGGRFADICRVGDPIVVNIFENVSIEDKGVANDAWGTLPLPDLDLKPAASVLKTKKGINPPTEYIALNGDPRENLRIHSKTGSEIIAGVTDGFFEAVGTPYKSGHASCESIRRPKTGVSEYYNIDSQPWPESQPILRSFVSPLHWHHPAEVCKKEVIPGVIYSNINAAAHHVGECTRPKSPGENEFNYIDGYGERWWKNVPWKRVRSDDTPDNTPHHTIISNVQHCQTWELEMGTSEVVKRNYRNRVLSAPVAGLLDILIAPKISTVGPFNITLQTVPAFIELVNNDDAMGIQTIVRANHPYRVDLMALITDSSLANKDQMFFMTNKPDWIAFDSATGSAVGIAPPVATTVRTDKPSAHPLLCLFIYRQIHVFMWAPNSAANGWPPRTSSTPTFSFPSSWEAGQQWSSPLTSGSSKITPPTATTTS